jgi:hypothetical protein
MVSDTYHELCVCVRMREETQKEKRPGTSVRTYRYLSSRTLFGL